MMMKLFLVHAAIIFLSRPSHGFAITDPHDHSQQEPVVVPLPSLATRPRQAREIDKNDQSLAKIRLPSPDQPEQSGNSQVTSSVRRVSASVGISEVVGNSTRQISQTTNENKNKSSDSQISNDGGNNRASISQTSNEGVNKSADVDEWKPFIAVNLDDQEERDTLTSSSTTTRKTPMSSSKRPPTTGFVIKQVLGYLILPNI